MKIKIINTTTNSKKTANQISKILVKKKLSPCVQIIPNIKSVYYWNDKIEKTGEVLLHIKTIPKNIQDCKKVILKYHNYNTPEIIIIDGAIIYDKYRDWFLDNVREI